MRSRGVENDTSTTSCFTVLDIIYDLQHGVQFLELLQEETLGRDCKPPYGTSFIVIAADPL